MICHICHTHTATTNAVFCARCGYQFRDPNQISVRYATFGRRMAALAIDYAVLSYPVYIVAFVLFPPEPYERIMLELGPEAVARDPRIALNMFLRLSGMMTFTYILFFFYQSAFVSSRMQGTLGKYWLGIKVVDRLGGRLSYFKAALREVFRIASVMPMHLGFFWALVDRERRTFHDMLAGTLVVHASNTISGISRSPAPPPFPPSATVFRQQPPPLPK